jgi:ATP-dependent exoDNAse (exonuclease V) alpha subunit
MANQSVKDHLKALIAARRAAESAANIALAQTPIASAIQQSEPVQSNTITALDKYGNVITYNAEQQEFVTLASSGKSCILIGAAGTGKTTCMRGVTESLVQSGIVGILSSEGHKHLPPTGTPGIVICAYTRRAVANIRKNLSPDLANNCITIHKLLEYQPVYDEVQDPATGKMRKTMSFQATRNKHNPLPQSIHTIIYEESSMIGTDLYREVQAALSHPVQEIFLGDIQQLPPVFGPAVLGFKLLSLPTVELTQVYRQALEQNPIRQSHSSIRIS